ncbi:hypothetical protein COPCOM_01554 [Coprococcus comes ATCC 27758]|uniref:Uncharacterized protein n=1 Tax=Coprococcus comes ATCC 27758 TaxID=470146 RepID=C0B8T0_9FIRM|nr:hypothetical protein COPCOM_01554 [Coprococcus comes ATCC 27758]
MDTEKTSKKCQGVSLKNSWQILRSIASENMGEPNLKRHKKKMR